MNPTALREALGAFTGRKFSVREMHDAAELMATLWDQVGAWAGRVLWGQGRLV